MKKQEESALMLRSKETEEPTGLGKEEIFDVYDEKGRRLGTATRAQVHSNPSLVHRAVHVLVFRPSGRLVLQKRAKTKDVEPGKWDTSAGGHLAAGESYETAARRELKEELGLEILSLQHLYDFKYRSEKESEDVRTYRVFYDGPLRPDPLEIEQLREWSEEEIEAARGRGVFSDHFEKEWEAFKRWREREKR